MRKSLNNKRNELGEEHIADLTHIYGEFRDGETKHFGLNGVKEEFVVSKVFDNTDFGFRQITVERPLRLNFQAAHERIERLQEATAFQSLAKSRKKDKKQIAAEEIAGRREQEEILAAVRSLDPDQLYKSRESFVADLETAFGGAALTLKAPIRKAILASLSERDETAEICRDAAGNPEADSELRDYENVPLKESIYDYFEQEVKPHVPDGWINEMVRDHKDGEVGKVGYEIPLTRHFYKYIPPRELEQIETEIADLEKDIVRMLREVVA